MAASFAASLGGGKGGFSLVVLFVAHQLMQLARIFLKVRWLAYVVDQQRAAAS